MPRQGGRAQSTTCYFQSYSFLIRSISFKQQFRFELQQTFLQTYTDSNCFSPRVSSYFSSMSPCSLILLLWQWHATSVALTACNISDFCCTFWSKAKCIPDPSHRASSLAATATEGSLSVCVCAKEFIVENYQEADIFTESNFTLVPLGQRRHRQHRRKRNKLKRQSAINVHWQDFYIFRLFKYTCIYTSLHCM